VLRVWDLRYGETNAKVLQFEGRPHDWSVRGLWLWRLMLIPGLAGLVILRRRRVMVWPLVSMLAMVTITAVGVYGHIRFRTVGDLVIIVGTAVTIDALVSWRRPRADTTESPPADTPPAETPPAETTLAETP
jgi:hypothetical protein